MSDWSLIRERVSSWVSTKKTSVKWATFERRKLERTLKDVRRWTSKLKEIPKFFGEDLLKHVLPSQSNQSEVIVATKDQQALEMIPHGRLRSLASKTTADDTDYIITQRKLPPYLSKGAEKLSITCLIDTTTNKPEKTPCLIEFKERCLAPTPSDSNAPPSQDESQIRHLASILACATQFSLPILPFKGYIRNPLPDNMANYAFVYDFPATTSQSELVNLRELLSSDDPTAKLPLAQRFQIAKDVATAVGTLHADGWVHKSLRSENIVLFTSSNSDTTAEYSQPYLVGFDYSRQENAATDRTWDEDHERNLYRHPDRQGPPLVGFTRNHDLYALGLVLLEIGMWRPLLEIWEGARERKSRVSGKMPQVNRRLTARYLKEAAGENMAHTMGEAYKKAVISCLEVKTDDQKPSDQGIKEFYVNVIRDLDAEEL